MSAVRCACYVRVSTTSRSRQGDKLSFENPEVQEQPLRELIAQRGWELYRVYSDRTSGGKESRPGLDGLMGDAPRGAFTVVLVWRFDRFARNVKQLVLALEEFRSLRIDFVSHQEALDTSTPMGKAMFTIIAAMAELERSVIRERVLAGSRTRPSTRDTIWKTRWTASGSLSLGPGTLPSRTRILMAPDCTQAGDERSQRAQGMPGTDCDVVGLPKISIRVLAYSFPGGEATSGWECTSPSWRVDRFLPPS